MGKRITTSFAKRKNLTWFNDKKALVLVKQRNLGGEEINEGTTIVIIGRGRMKDDFNIRDEKSKIEIHNVWCEQLELLDDGNN